MTFSVLARDPATGDLGHRRLVLHPRRRPGRAERAPGRRRRRRAGAQPARAGHVAARRARRRRRARPSSSAAPRTPPRTPTGRSPSSTPPAPVAADTGPGSFPVCGHLVGDGLQRAGQHARLRRRAAGDGPGVRRRARRPARPAAGRADRRPGRRAATCAAGSRPRCSWSAATPATDEDDGVRMDLRVDDSGDPVAQLRMLRNLQRAYDERDYEMLAAVRARRAPATSTPRWPPPAGATARRPATALEAMRARPGLVGVAGGDGRRRAAVGGVPPARVTVPDGSPEGLDPGAPEGDALLRRMPTAGRSTACRLHLRTGGSS